MYPYFRFARLVLFQKKDPTFSPLDENVMNLRVLFTDRDIYPELNNGRYYQMMDLARTQLGQKLGLLGVLRKNRWALAAAGSSGMWRRRILWGQKYQIRTQVIYFDHRWYYFYQRFMRGDVIHASFLLRVGVAGKEGLIAPQRVNEALGFPDLTIEKPEWVEAWLKSEEFRPPV